MGAQRVQPPQASAAVDRGAEPPTPDLLVSLPRERLDALRSLLQTRGATLLPLAGLAGPAWAVGFERAAFVGSVFGVLGAIAGALLGRGELALPLVGWLPASVVCGAAFAGGVGAFAFSLAYVLDQLAPRASTGARVFCLVRASASGLSLGPREAEAHGGEIVTSLPAEAAASAQRRTGVHHAGEARP